MSRLLLALLAVFGFSDLTAQQSGWHLVPATLPSPRISDARLVLHGMDRPSGPHSRLAADSAVAQLVIACDSRLPGPEGRTLYFHSAEAMEPFGGEGYATLRFDHGRWKRATYLDLVDQPLPADGLAPLSGSLRLGFLGDDASPYYSSELLHDMLGSNTLTVTYLAFGEERSVSFALAGLGEALPRLGSCRWEK